LPSFGSSWPQDFVFGQKLKKGCGLYWVMTRATAWAALGAASPPC
jgi:hypothetical protein